MDVVQFSKTTGPDQKKDEYQIFDIKYCNEKATGTKLANIQHNLTHPLVSQREDNVFSVKCNSECSGLL